MGSDERDDRLWVTVDEICRLLDNGQKYHAQAAQQYGEIKDAYEGFRKVVAETNPEAFMPSYQAFEKYRAFLAAKEQSRPRIDVSTTGYTALGSAVAHSDAAFVPRVQDYAATFLAPPTSWTPPRSEGYAARLEKLDPELGRMYRGIAEAFWGSTQNPERTAFALTRQVFDHLFHVLAPNEKVRESPYFKPKPETEKALATRVERIYYAAYTHVKDRTRADYLAEQATEMVDAYQRLNELHRRGEIDRRRARNILQSMMAFLEAWVEALEL